MGLAKSPAAQQIMSKLPIFTNNELQQLVREPVLQDKRGLFTNYQMIAADCLQNTDDNCLFTSSAEHVKFQQHAMELIKRVSGPGDQAKILGESDFSLEMLHRASVVAQTKITFPKKQLLQLIQVCIYLIIA